MRRPLLMCHYAKRGPNEPGQRYSPPNVLPAASLPRSTGWKVRLPTHEPSVQDPETGESGRSAANAPENELGSEAATWPSPPNAPIDEETVPLPLGSPQPSATDDPSRQILGAIISLDERTKNLTELVERRLLYDQTKEVAFRRLYEELDALNPDFAGVARRSPAAAVRVTFFGWGRFPRRVTEAVGVSTHGPSQCEPDRGAITGHTMTAIIGRRSCRRGRDPYQAGAGRIRRIAWSELVAANRNRMRPA